MILASTLWQRLALSLSALTLGGSPLWAAADASSIEGGAGYHFEVATTMPVGLGGHAATLLDSGKVLVAGGQIQSGAYQATCYLFDPTRDEWTTTGTLTLARRGIKLAHLADGDVLAVGGSTGNSSARVERYLAASGQWVEVGSMALPRDSHAVVALDDGAVLVLGGRDLQSGVGTIMSSVERFDPATGSWQTAAPMLAARMNHTATLLENGEVLVAGGYAGSGVGSLSSAEIYNPGTNAWRQAAALPERRLNHIDLPLPSGEIMLVGGNLDAFGAGVSVGLIYDAVQNSWRASAASTYARRNTSAVRLADGKIAVIGGGSSSELPVSNSAEIYDSAANTWTLTGAMIERRMLHVSVVLPGGDVLLMGGQRPTPALAYISATEKMMVPRDAVFTDGFDLPAVR